MDIFDAVIEWLEAEKEGGRDKIYLSTESKRILNEYLAMVNDREALDAWIAERGADVEVVCSVKDSETEEVLPEVEVPVQTVEEAVAEEAAVEVSSVVENVHEPEAVVENVQETEVVVEDEPESVASPAAVEVAVVGSRADYEIAVVGNSSADLMFLGEEMFEMAGQQPFAKSQQLLEKMINAMGYSLEDVAIVSVLKRKESIEADEPLRSDLAKVVGEISPRVIALMGALPSRVLVGVESSIISVHGSWLNYGDIQCMPTFHPFYLSRVQARKREAWGDLQKIMQFLQS